MTAPLVPGAARTVFLLLTLTRWFPVGLTVPVLLLYQLGRGQSVPQALTVSAIGGVTSMLLELPTSGFTDGFGRRPVYVVAAVVNVAASCVYLGATSFAAFAVGALLMGTFRALDSGPLEAWYVDTVHRNEPGADVDAALALQGTVLGLAIAAGSLLSGVLVWWHPVTSMSALTLPVLVFTVLNTVHLVAVTLLMRESQPVSAGGFQRVLATARETPSTVVGGLKLLRGNEIVRGLVMVEVFWSIAMVVFEQFQPIRLGELLGSDERAGAWMGPVAGIGWAVFALGSAVAGVAARRIGIARTAAWARGLNGVGAIGMGVVMAPSGLIGAYLATYALHGATGPMHGALLHREATAANRATVLSVNSLMSSAGFAVAAPLLGLLAAASSNRTAMVTGGVVSLLGVACYLPALRHDRAVRAPAALGDPDPS